MKKLSSAKEITLDREQVFLKFTADIFLTLKKFLNILVSVILSVKLFNNTFLARLLLYMENSNSSPNK